MKLLCLIDCLGPGGAQRQLCALATQLSARRTEVRVLTYHKLEFFLPLLREAGVGYECLPAGLSKLGRAHALRRALRGGSHDVVLAMLDGPNLIAELASIPSRRWGLVVSERGLGASNRARVPWRRLLHRTADYVLTNSHTNRLMIERSVPALAGRVATIYNTLDLEEFSPSSPVEARRPRSLRVAVVARYDANKNMSALVEAVAIAAKLAPDLDITVDWYGRIAGTVDGGLQRVPYDKAVQMIQERGLEDRVRFHSETSDVIGILRSADAVALPSFIEGLPNTICEAMACGRPVLMSGVCDASNLVDEGRSGLLFDPASPDDIARALISLAEMDPLEREALGQRGRAIAERSFDSSKVISKFTEILQAAAHRERIKFEHWLPEIPATAYRTLGVGSGDATRP